MPTSNIDPNVIGVGNVSKSLVKAQLQTAKDEINALYAGVDAAAVSLGSVIWGSLVDPGPAGITLTTMSIPAGISRIRLDVFSRFQAGSAATLMSHVVRFKDASTADIIPAITYAIPGDANLYTQVTYPLVVAIRTAVSGDYLEFAAARTNPAPLHVLAACATFYR